MKRTIPLLALGCLTAFITPSLSQPKTTAKVVPGVKPRGFDIKPGGVDLTKKAEKTGTRYRLHMSFNPTSGLQDGDEGQTGDGNFECYGNLEINGLTYWAMPYANRNKNNQKIMGHFVPNNVPTKEQAMGYGISLTKGNTFNQNRPFEFDAYKNDTQTNNLHVVLKLYDSDSYGNDRSRDDLFGNYDFKLDLSKGESGYFYFWKDGDGNGSNLWVYVEPIKDLYDSNGTPFAKPQVKPDIIKPDVVIKRPGPVIRTKPLVR